MIVTRILLYIAGGACIAFILTVLGVWAYRITTCDHGPNIGCEAIPAMLLAFILAMVCFCCAAP